MWFGGEHEFEEVIIYSQESLVALVVICLLDSLIVHYTLFFFQCVYVLTGEFIHGINYANDGIDESGDMVVDVE